MVSSESPTQHLQRESNCNLDGPCDDHTVLPAILTICIASCLLSQVPGGVLGENFVLHISQILLSVWVKAQINRYSRSSYRR